MRYASIDIGTNTILMLIADVDDALGLKPVKDFYSVPRIGKSVSVTKTLDGAAIGRATDILKGYRDVADEYRVERIVASATSAVRDAANRNEFVANVKDTCGIEVEVVEGILEAKLGFLGAVSGEADKSRESLVIDIGGGSTEFSYGTGIEPGLFKSLDVGAVRVTEMFFKHNPPSDEELRSATEFVNDVLDKFPFSRVAPERLFAVAGTPTTIALICQKRFEFDSAAVNNYYMSGEALNEVISLIRSKSPAEIRKLTSAAEGREDVLLAGAVILRESLRKAGSEGFLVTDRGLRYGYLLHKHLQLTGK